MPSFVRTLIRAHHLGSAYQGSSYRIPGSLLGPTLRFLQPAKGWFSKAPHQDRPSLKELPLPRYYKRACHMCQLTESSKRPVMKLLTSSLLYRGSQMKIGSIGTQKPMWHQSYVILPPIRTTFSNGEIITHHHLILKPASLIYPLCISHLYFTSLFYGPNRSTLALPTRTFFPHIFFIAVANWTWCICWFGNSYFFSSFHVSYKPFGMHRTLEA